MMFDYLAGRLMEVEVSPREPSLDRGERAPSDACMNRTKCQRAMVRTLGPDESIAEDGRERWLDRDDRLQLMISLQVILGTPLREGLRLGVPVPSLTA